MPLDSRIEVKTLCGLGSFPFLTGLSERVDVDITPPTFTGLWIAFETETELLLHIGLFLFRLPPLLVEKGVIVRVLMVDVLIQLVFVQYLFASWVLWEAKRLMDWTFLSPTKVT